MSIQWTPEAEDINSERHRRSSNVGVGLYSINVRWQPNVERPLMPFSASSDLSLGTALDP